MNFRVMRTIGNDISPISEEYPIVKNYDFEDVQKEKNTFGYVHPWYPYIFEGRLKLVTIEDLMQFVQDVGEECIIDWVGYEPYIEIHNSY